MSDYQIPVKIRVDADVKAVPLLSVPFGTDLDSVLDLIGEWGVNTEYGDYGQGDLVGQFVVAGGDAYFEVIISTEQP